MSDAVLVAIITGLCAVVGQWLISRKQNQDRKDSEIERDTRVEMRLQSLEKKLDEHNSYAKRFEEITIDIAQIKTELKLRNQKGA